MGLLSFGFCKKCDISKKKKGEKCKISMPHLALSALKTDSLVDHVSMSLQNHHPN